MNSNPQIAIYSQILHELAWARKWMNQIALIGMIGTVILVMAFQSSRLYFPVVFAWLIPIAAGVLYLRKKCDPNRLRAMDTLGYWSRVDDEEIGLVISTRLDYVRQGVAVETGRSVIRDLYAALPERAQLELYEQQDAEGRFLLTGGQSPMG